MREATELEKRLDIESLGDEMDAAQAELEELLLEWRKLLIAEGIADLEALDATTYHLLSIGESLDLAALTALLAKIHDKGRELVRRELEMQGVSIDKPSNDVPEALAILAGITASRLINDVGSRVAGAAIRLALIERDEEELLPRVEEEMSTGGIGYIAMAAAGIVHVALSQGRGAEAAAQAEKIDHVLYSAVLDNNTCEYCEDADGESGLTEDDITPVPNPDCLGGANCRCVLIYVAV